jgi:hypothetical protein
MATKAGGSGPEGSSEPQDGSDEPQDGSSAERATDDRAWENDLTEEDMASPEEREEVAHDLTIDPD